MPHEALSTTPSTLLWLIPAFHVDQIAGGSALVLLLLAGGLLSASLRKARAMAIALPALCFLQAPPLARTVLDSGTRAEVVFRQGSFYGPIRVVDYTYPPNHTREMLIGGIIQGGLDVVSGEPVYPYDYFLERAALSFVPQARRALIVGLGPGVMTARLAKYGLSGTVVEIVGDPSKGGKTFFDGDVIAARFDGVTSKVTVSPPANFQPAKTEVALRAS